MAKTTPTTTTTLPASTSAQEQALAGTPSNTATATAGSGAGPLATNAVNGATKVSLVDPQHKDLSGLAGVFNIRYNKAGQNVSGGPPTINQATADVGSMSDAQRLQLASVLNQGGFLATVSSTVSTIQTALKLAMESAANKNMDLSTLLAQAASDNAAAKAGQPQMPTYSTYATITDPVTTAQTFDNVSQQLTGGFLSPELKARYINWFHNNQIIAATNKELSKGAAQQAGSGNQLTASLQSMMSTVSSDPTAAAEYFIRTQDPIDYSKYAMMGAAQAASNFSAGAGTRLDPQANSPTVATV